MLEGVKAELLLMTNRLHREVVRRQIPVKDTKLHPLGVLVKTDNIPLIMQVRTFRKKVLLPYMQHRFCQRMHRKQPHFCRVRYV